MRKDDLRVKFWIIPISAFLLIGCHEEREAFRFAKENLDGLKSGRYRQVYENLSESERKFFPLDSLIGIKTKVELRDTLEEKSEFVSRINDSTYLFRTVVARNDWSSIIKLQAKGENYDALNPKPRIMDTIDICKIISTPNGKKLNFGIERYDSLLIERQDLINKLEESISFEVLSVKPSDFLDNVEVKLSVKNSGSVWMENSWVDVFYDGHKVESEYLGFSIGVLVPKSSDQVSFHVDREGFKARVASDIKSGVDHRKKFTFKLTHPAFPGLSIGEMLESRSVATKDPFFGFFYWVTGQVRSAPNLEKL